MPDNQLLKKWFLLFHIAAVVCVGIFVLAHGFTMGIAYDETYSLKLIKEHYFRAMPGSANTHWLNTLFMLVLHQFFGDNIGWLRLHSMLAFPFFAHGIFTLVKNSRYLLMGFAAYCLVVFNPYIIDFFSLARGYALALTFQAWMLVYLFKAVELPSFNYRYWRFVFLFAALAIVANLTYVYGAIAAETVLLSCLFLFKTTDYSWRNKAFRTTFILLAAIIAFAFADLLFMKFYAKTLEYGGDNLIASVFESVLHRSQYFITDVFTPSLKGYLLFTVIVLLTVYGVAGAIYYKRGNALFTVAVLLAVIIVFNYVFHILFKSPYLYVRTAVQWYVPAIMALTLTLGQLQLSASIKRYALVAGSLLTGLVMMVHFTRHANVYTCLEWMRTEDVYRCYKDLEQMHPSSFLMHDKFYGLYELYYSITDHHPMSIPFTYLADAQLQHSDSATRHLLQQHPYIIDFQPSAVSNYLYQQHIPFTVVKQYDWSGFRIIKIN